MHIFQNRLDKYIIFLMQKGGILSKEVFVCRYTYFNEYAISQEYTEYHYRNMNVSLKEYKKKHSSLEKFSPPRIP